MQETIIIVSFGLRVVAGATRQAVHTLAARVDVAPADYAPTSMRALRATALARSTHIARPKLIYSMRSPAA